LILGIFRRVPWTAGGVLQTNPKEPIMIVRDVLLVKSGETFSIPPESQITDSIRLMVEHDIGSLVVMDSAGKMIGIITERDIMRAAHKYSCDLGKLTVRDLMTSRLIVCGPDDTVDYVRGIMTKNHIRHLPVVDEENLLGVITFHDVARACLNEANFENELLKRYIKHWPE
jgi:CBS domain-containing protein